MNLFINSPAYYTQKFGVIDEVYQLCLKISTNIDVLDYTRELETIGITPIISPDEVIASGCFKEVKKINLTYKMANISLHLNYLNFCAAETDVKKEMIMDNIFESLEIIKIKLKEKFDYESLKRDIENLIREDT